MAFYKLRCGKCADETEQFLKFEQVAETACEKCGELALEIQIQPVRYKYTGVDYQNRALNAKPDKDTIRFGYVSTNDKGEQVFTGGKKPEWDDLSGGGVEDYYDWGEKK